MLSINWSVATKGQLEGTEPWGENYGYFHDLDTSNGDDFTNIKETIEEFFNILDDEFKHEFLVDPWVCGFEYDEYGHQKEIIPDSVKFDIVNYEVTYYQKGEPVLKYYDFYCKALNDDCYEIKLYPDGKVEE